MRATGIVRRIDDLGRVVIPKEIRRTLRIKEGDPLELFVSSDGQGVEFRKYEMYNSEEWEKLKAIILRILPHTPFALLDAYGDCKGSNLTTSVNTADLTLEKITTESIPYHLHRIASSGDVLAYLAVGKTNYNAELTRAAIGVMEEYLAAVV